MKKQIHVLDGVVIGSSWTAAAGVTITPALKEASVLEVDADSRVDVGWHVVITGGTVKFSAPAPVSPTIGPNEFYFLWTMAEQVAIEDLRQVDPAIKLFMRRLDDPRTLEVVLADAAVQAMVAHTVAELVAKGVIAEADASARTAAIIAGPAR